MMRLLGMLVILTCCSAGAETFLCKTTGGAHQLDRSTIYGEAQRFGFESGSMPEAFSPTACSSAKPFYFSVAEPDGDYRVTVILGGPGASVTTVKGEARRLYVSQLALLAGSSRKQVFNVAVRTKTITGTSDVVKLKPREVGAADWDGKLTLEFSGTPSVRSISVETANVPVVYLAGDSTVVDQDKEPWAAWGQMLPVFFNDKISIANEAESGETIRSFVGEKRLENIESTWKKGDFLLVQFAHNDQKLGPGYVPPQTEYKDLLRRYIRDARSAGVMPILVTSMNRRSFDDQGRITQTLGEYPQAMRDVAAEEHVALIDLNAISKTLFEAIGPQETLHAFVHFPANTFPDQPEELKDDTHFTSWGAYLLAQGVVQSIRDQHLPLEKYVKAGTPPFRPDQPMRFEDFHLPASPSFSASTPYGDSGKVAK